jgi:hypothetical protein
MRGGVADRGERSASEADIIKEARRVCSAAAQAGVVLKLAGGLGIYLHSPSARRVPLRREYGDLDFVAPSEQRSPVQHLLKDLGYQPDVPFNTLNGIRRLRYWDPRHQRQLDVFLDQVRMCHTIDLRPRLGLPDISLAPADLFLLKMQIVEINLKDLADVVALLLDHPVAQSDDDAINRTYIAGLAARDWGLYRTLRLNVERLLSVLPDLPVPAEPVRRRLDEVWHAVEAHPKSLAWRLRAYIGDRVRWYEVPEEPGRTI